jgi:hypothetical protein
VLWGAAVAALAVALVQAAIGFGGEPAEVVTQSCAGCLAVAACLARAAYEPVDSRAWIVLAVGLLCLASLGIVYVADETAILAFPESLPGLLGYPLTLLGWALLARRRLPGLPRALWLDAAIGGLALGAVGGAIVYEAALGGGVLTDAEFSQLLYVVIDLTLAGVMLTAGVLAGGRRAKTLLLLAAGAAVLAIADSIYAARVGAGDTTFTAMLGIAWMAGIVLAAAAATVVDDPPERAEVRPLSLIAVPVLGTLAALSVPLVLWGESKFLTWVASSVLVLSVARLAISLLDNQRAEQRRRRAAEERRAREEAERADQAPRRTGSARGRPGRLSAAQPGAAQPALERDQVRRSRRRGDRAHRGQRGPRSPERHRCRTRHPRGAPARAVHAVRARAGSRQRHRGQRLGPGADQEPGRGHGRGDRPRDGLGRDDLLDRAAGHAEGRA